jgi:cobalamin biosynthesis protein CobT
MLPTSVPVTQDESRSAAARNEGEDNQRSNGMRSTSDIRRPSSRTWQFVYEPFPHDTGTNDDDTDSTDDAASNLDAETEKNREAFGQSVGASEQRQHTDVDQRKPEDDEGVEADDEDEDDSKDYAPVKFGSRRKSHRPSRAEVQVQNAFARLRFVNEDVDME